MYAGGGFWDFGIPPPSCRICWFQVQAEDLGQRAQRASKDAGGLGNFSILRIKITHFRLRIDSTDAQYSTGTGTGTYAQYSTILQQYYSTIRYPSRSFFALTVITRTVALYLCKLNSAIRCLFCASFHGNQTIPWNIGTVPPKVVPSSYCTEGRARSSRYTHWYTLPGIPDSTCTVQVRYSTVPYSDADNLGTWNFQQALQQYEYE